MNRKQTCKKCGKKKSTSKFQLDKRTKSGFASRCIDCGGRKLGKRKEGVSVQAGKGNLKIDSRDKPEIMNLKIVELCPHCRRLIEIAISPVWK